MGFILNNMPLKEHFQKTWLVFPINSTVVESFFPQQGRMNRLQEFPQPNFGIDQSFVC